MISFCTITSNRPLSKERKFRKTQNLTILLKITVVENSWRRKSILTLVPIKALLSKKWSFLWKIFNMLKHTSTWMNFSTTLIQLKLKNKLKIDSNKFNKNKEYRESQDWAIWTIKLNSWFLVLVAQKIIILFRIPFRLWKKSLRNK